jgi:thiol:disulfide interchange protein DsbD
MQTRYGTRLALLLITFMLPQVVSSQPLRAKHSTVELLSWQSSVAPGAEIMVGLHFVLEHGWHIYWVNPGDSGQPPVLKWLLPPGMVAGDVQWPRPERLQSSPTMVDYGYHGDVLLPVRIHIPASASRLQKAELAVDAKWLICREVCLSDHAELRLYLPVTSKARDDPSSGPLFMRTEKLLPKAMPESWKTAVESMKEDFFLSIDVGERISSAEFFPLDAAQIDNAARKHLQPTARGINIVLKKSDLLMKPVRTFRGVLVIPGRGVYRLQAPVGTRTD